jgi:PAS domain S-box-containing protein
MQNKVRLAIFIIAFLLLIPVALSGDRLPLLAKLGTVAFFLACGALHFWEDWRNTQGKLIKELSDKILFSKQQLEAVFDAQDDALCMVDRDFQIYRLNKAYAKACNKDIKSLLGQKSHDLFPGIKRINPDALTTRTFETGEPISSIPFETPSTENRLYFMFNTYPILNEGRTLYVLEHFRNISAEKKMNEQLIRSANLASIGTMIAGIAHEMNNPLSGISGCASNMLTSPETYGMNPKGQERMKDILDSASRAESILKGLLDLSRKKESRFIIMNITPILERALQSIHLEGYDNVKKTLVVDPGLRPVVNCDPTRMTQVFINLLSNATFSVLDRARAEEAQGGSLDPEIKIHVNKRQGFLHIKFIDNGLGIPPDKMTQIFDPFYTTRPPGQGTGLGLSICHKIMLEHNGRLTLETYDKGNTCFCVEFPLTGVI